MEKGAIKISSGSTAAGGEPALLARLLATKFQGLADRGETKGVEPGTMLVVEGQRATDLYILLEGEVEVMTPMGQDWVRVAVLGPGSAIGEMAFLDDLPRSARVIAAQRCKVLQISRESFEEYSKQEPELALSFVLELSKIVAYRLRRLEQFDAADAAREKERKTLAGELHDQTLAELGGLAVELGLLGLQASGVSEELKEGMDEVRERLKETDRKLRGIVQGIYPTALSIMGLIAAVNSYLNELAMRPVAGAQGLEIELEVTGFGEERLKEEMEIGIYRVIQQGVENVIQHAQARKVKIELRWTEGEVKLALADDGVGFDVENPRESPFTGHFGLASLRDRIERFLGLLEIESEPGRGTTLRARIPVVGEGPRPQETRISRHILQNHRPDHQPAPSTR